ncbi:MAG: DCC1-like thiol-disulfide oxidoreductase family protein [Archangium sp.]|nr:DCC1-like thiol-disulfide oxidoreductase family protein [Archangium sp.]
MKLEAMWVLYDETCGFCCKCADWLRTQHKLVPLTCLPRGGETSRRVFAGLPWGHDELVVVDSTGGVYRGTEAFVMALWALDDYRVWAERASHEPLKSRARSLFHGLSSRRHELSRAMKFEPEAQLIKVIDRVAKEPEAQGCKEGACELPRPASERPAP